ncbi:MAG TPA: hypothetical protein VGK89_00045 [Candidatus Eisenbacteria bacterium]|jgi:hypothetical protein
MLRTTILLILDMFPAATGAVADSCPQSSVCAHQCAFSPAAVRDTSYFFACGAYGYSEAGERYDLGAGTASSTAAGDNDCPASGSLATYDVFRLVGPASGTPLAFSAIARLAGNVESACDPYAYASASVHFEEAGGKSRDFALSLSTYSCGAQPIDQSLGIPLAHAVGDTFTLVVRLASSAQGYSAATIESQLGFEGLPQGYAVVSCQGFVSDPNVPVRAVSWGRVKATYR